MTSRPRPRLFLPLLSGALLLAAASLVPITIVAAPANLARSDSGARLTLFSSSNAGDGTARAAEALLSEADPLGCALGSGTTTILLSLPRAETLRRFDFLNLTAAGRVSVAVSNVALPVESPRWRTVPTATGGGIAFGAPDEVVACELGHVEARHLKITFETQAAGRIDTFGLFGAGSNVAATAVTSTDHDARPRLVAYQTVGVAGDGRGDATHLGGFPGARVLRVSSGSGAPDRIVDGSLGTGHAFAVSDRRPAALIALGARRNITRVSIACRTLTAGRIELYALTKRADADADAPLPPVGRQPDATARVEGGRSGLSRVSVPFNAENIRYLAVVFVPDAGGATPAGGGKDFRDYKDARDYKGGGGGAAGSDAPEPAGRSPRTGTGTTADLPPEGPGTATPPDGSFVLTEVTPTGPLSPTGPGDFSVNSILPPGTASNTFFNPGSNSPLDTPILPPPVGSDFITP